MSSNSTVTRRNTSGFANRLLHKALSERGKKNERESERPQTPSQMQTTQAAVDKKPIGEKISG